ncbi:hypothetical protein [Hathewaya massiliensis]|nr:hypothetical protein [Hathewaya massiliensis]
MNSVLNLTQGISAATEEIASSITEVTINISGINDILIDVIIQFMIWIW